MRRTLFYIPHEIGGLPVFGWGWALILWSVFCAVVLLRSVRRGGFDHEARGQIPMLLIVGAVIVFLIPKVEEPIGDVKLTIPPAVTATGLPIRGYGVMLLVAVVCGVGLSAVRAVRAGLGVEAIMSLAFVMVIGGIVGARLFFMIQYWHLLRGATWSETLANLISIDRGGLVVYGSLIGATVAFVLFCFRSGLAVLPLADLIAPSLALGLAVGRIGCLMNGCCFGSTCDHAWAVRFPPDSPPYVDQKGYGQLHGLRIAADDDDAVRVIRIDADGPFGSTPLRTGDRIVSIDGAKVDGLASARTLFERAGPWVTLTRDDGRTIRGGAAALPTASRPVHPTQIYSALNALLLALLALTFYPFRRRHGQVIAALLSLYAVTRFLLELIRTDEGLFWGTLTISQNISLLIVVSMIALWIYVQRQPWISPPTSVFEPQGEVA